MARKFGRRSIIKGAVGVGLANIAVAPLIQVSRAADVTKVAGIFVGPTSDYGWSWAHNQGLLAMESHFKGRVKYDWSESVPEGSDSVRVLADYAEKGYDLIIGTSFGYMDPIIEVAQKYPKTKFIHISGYKRAENVNTAFGKIEEARYVTGIVAGHYTKTNIIGYVAAFPTPEVIRGINSFTLGVRSVNPKATTHVTWTLSWYDPNGERQAAEALLERGADVIAQHQDTTNAQQAAMRAGKFGVGYDSDMGAQDGLRNTVLTSAVWDWSKYYIPAVQSVLDGTWKGNSDYWGGWPDGLVGIAPFGPMVSSQVQAEASAAAKLFADSKKDVFDVFAGPINDQNGKLKVKAGQKMDHDALWSMDWLVEGVVGKIPS